ncbi:Ldh family oxidoreductase [Streptomyces sp. CA-210063]|uniref:Ldh family oxidoreductase n=1 Tax=Streptomyces sp. CA-210063 TaxID=2801029 RepID=UPI00214D0768|nr:Ldh family oxidoreductase [Streptomyces sp. CA-210063]UUU29359.1 Ldh family oxidoreductase [Streptomyces sp. CA-210063]
MKIGRQPYGDDGAACRVLREAPGPGGLTFAEELGGTLSRRRRAGRRRPVAQSCIPFIAVDPAAFGGAEGFTEGVEATLSTLKGLPVADGVYYPGERSAAVAVERAARGIPVAPRLWRELMEHAEKLGVTPPTPVA